MRFNYLNKLNFGFTLKAILFCGLAFFTSCKRDMSKYDNLIAELKKNNHEINKRYYYKIKDFDNLNTLIVTKDDEPRDESLGTITLLKTENNLSVYIATTHLGHGGGKGLAYSENGGPPNFGSDEWGNWWTMGSQINKNWWNLIYTD